MKKETLIDLIIQKEKTEYVEERPFLQLPLYNDLYQETEEVKPEVKEEPKRVIIIDL
jgi:hypothetical protein